MIVLIREQMGFWRTVSFTLVLLWRHSVGGSETNRVWFSVAFWDVTTVVALFSIFSIVIEEFNPCKKSSYWGTFWHFTCSFFSGKKLHQKDWIIGIQFYFGLNPRFLCKSFFYSTALSFFMIFIKIIVSLNLAASTWIQIKKNFSILNFIYFLLCGASFVSQRDTLALC